AVEQTLDLGGAEAVLAPRSAERAEPSPLGPEHRRAPVDAEALGHLRRREQLVGRPPNRFRSHGEQPRAPTTNSFRNLAHIGAPQESRRSMEAPAFRAGRFRYDVVGALPRERRRSAYRRGSRRPSYRFRWRRRS